MLYRTNLSSLWTLGLHWSVPVLKCLRAIVQCCYGYCDDRNELRLHLLRAMQKHTGSNLHRHMNMHMPMHLYMHTHALSLTWDGGKELHGIPVSMETELCMCHGAKRDVGAWRHLIAVFIAIDTDHVAWPTCRACGNFICFIIWGETNNALANRFFLNDSTMCHLLRWFCFTQHRYILKDNQVEANVRGLRTRYTTAERPVFLESRQ